MISRRAGNGFAPLGRVIGVAVTEQGGASPDLPLASFEDFFEAHYAGAVRLAVALHVYVRFGRSLLTTKVACRSDPLGKRKSLAPSSPKFLRLFVRLVSGNKSRTTASNVTCSFAFGSTAFICSDAGNLSDAPSLISGGGNAFSMISGSIGTALARKTSTATQPLKPLPPIPPMTPHSCSGQGQPAIRIGPRCRTCTVGRRFSSRSASNWCGRPTFGRTVHG